MNREQQIDNFEQIQEYIQNNNIRGLFSQLVQAAILEKPKNVLDFFIQKLQAPEKLTLFVVGPPGLSINSLIKKTLATSSRTFELYNCGQQISATIEKASEGEKKSFKSCRLISNQTIKPAIDKAVQLAKTNQNYIIQGFPKNLKQALILQSKGVYAKNILIVNIDEWGLNEILHSKLKALNPDLKDAQLNDLITTASMQYKIGINQIKKFYKNYSEIDLSRSREDKFVIQELRKAFTTQTIHTVPRITSQIIIMGSPYSGRTTLGKKLANRYNFVYISTSFLISEQIRRESIHGRKIKQQFLAGKFIDNFLIEKLIEQRISKKDCKMMGFVLEGYPKNKEQFQNIKHMKLSPTMFVAIDAPVEVSESRAGGKSQQLTARYDNWKNFGQYLRGISEKVFWVNSALSIGNLYEEVIYEFQKNLS